MKLRKNVINEEIEVERRLIEVLGEGHNQWNYRPDLKSEEDLWKNLRKIITRNNLSEIGEHPISDKEFDAIKIELLAKTQTPFDAVSFFSYTQRSARTIPIWQKKFTSLYRRAYMDLIQ